MFHVETADFGIIRSLDELAGTRLFISNQVTEGSPSQEGFSRACTSPAAQELVQQARTLADDDASWVVTTDTQLITLLITTHEPPSSVCLCRQTRVTTLKKPNS